MTVKEKIKKDLFDLGIRQGDVVLMHSSYKSLGEIEGGAKTFYNSFLELLGEEGTLVIPALSYNSVTRENPVFDRQNTPSCVGYLSEYFRTQVDGVIRSLHATHSCCAKGKLAKELTKDHQKDVTPVGEHSPFFKLPHYGGKILMLGCNTNNNTSMHGVEETTPAKDIYCIDNENPITYYLKDGEETIEQIAYRHDFMTKNGKHIAQRYGRVTDFLPEDKVRFGKVLEADCCLMDAKAVWEVGQKKMMENPLYFVEYPAEQEEKMNGRAFSYDYLLPRRKLKLPSGELLQVSELSLNKGGEIIEHQQFCDEITYAISGKATFYHDDKCEEVCGGQVHYIRAGGKHKVVASNDTNFRYICVGFHAAKDVDVLSSYYALREKTDWFVKDDDNSIRRLTDLLLNEFYLQEERQDGVIDRYLALLMVALSRIYEGKVRFMDKKNGSNSHYAVYHALRYIDRKYIYITGVKEVAKALSYTEYYLSHVFSEKVGISIKEYITRKKMETAANLLKSSDLSVDELAEYLHFNTSHTFRQAFKKIYGKSPTDYRKEKNKF